MHESFEKFWERHEKDAERSLAVARYNLEKIRFRQMGQMALFTMEAQIIPFPQREVIRDLIA